MFNCNDSRRLADLSMLELSEKEFERMTVELERAIYRAKKFFENDGTEPMVNEIEVSMLREDNIKSFEDTTSLLEPEKTNNNLFLSKRVV